MIKENDFDLIENTEPIYHLEPISSHSLPSDTTIGSILSFEHTLTGDVDQYELFTLLEIKKQNPDATYEEVIQMAKDPSISEPVKTKLKKESQKSFIIVDELQTPQNSIPTTTKTETEESILFKQFEKKTKLFGSTENIQLEVNQEEFGNIENVYIGGGRNTEAFKNMITNGVYGDLGDIATYFTTDYRVACSHIQNNEPILVEIDLKELLKQRKVYRDPESLFIEDESGKTFVLFNGIPVNIIKRIFVIAEE